MRTGDGVVHAGQLLRRDLAPLPGHAPAGKEEGQHGECSCIQTGRGRGEATEHDLGRAPRPPACGWRFGAWFTIVAPPAEGVARFVARLPPTRSLHPRQASRRPAVAGTRSPELNMFQNSRYVKTQHVAGAHQNSPMSPLRRKARYACSTREAAVWADWPGKLRLALI